VIEAINKWRYKPYSVKGKPIAMDTVISVRFAYN